MNIYYMDLTKALFSLYPSCVWELHNDNYEGLIWMDENTPKPSKQELVMECEKIINEQPWKVLRKQRDILIASTDKYATIDYPHTNEQSKQAWLDYRQALRDLPSVTIDVNNPVWPQSPNG